MLLLYVHLQVSIYQVSYSIEKKEKEVAKLSETYKLAKFRVSRLRSPHVLNQRMKQMSLDLITPKDQEVIRVLRPKVVPQDQKVAHAPMQFMSWLHIIKEAQAKVTKE